MINVLCCIRANGKRIGRILEENSRVKSRFLCCTVEKLHLNRGKLIEVPVCSPIATGREVRRQFIALEAPVKVVEVLQGVLVLLLQAQRFNDLGINLLCGIRPIITSVCCFFSICCLAQCWSIN